MALVASPDPGKNCSKLLDVRSIKSLILRQQFLKYVHRLLLEKDWEMGISVCSPCTEPQGDSHSKSSKTH